ncbi:MAG: MBL fold metallo-hydrolase [Halioglobus sp.]
MNKLQLSILLLPMALAALLLASGCQVTTKETVAAEIGTPVTQQQMLEALKQPGIITFHKHTVASWQVPLSGLLNLDHPKARAAGLEDREEPIEIYAYSLIHPTEGTFLVDSGVSERFNQAKPSPDIGLLVNAVMRFDEMKVTVTTKDIDSALSGIDGVLLTHLHLDHILGLTDLEKSTPVYVGPREKNLQTAMNAFTQGTTNRLLSNQTNLSVWNFGDGNIIDVFGDGHLFAIHAAGHTPGTTAYLANTTAGVELMIGDVTHTKWGWDNQVESGTYSHQPTDSARALAQIKAIADSIQNLKVHPGHQHL